MGTSYIVATAHTVENFNKGVDQRGPYIHVNYYIQTYSDTDRFINALVGAGTLTGPISGGKVTRNTPHFHPLSTNLACVSASLIMGLGNPVINASGYPDYDGGALIAAEYRPLTWDPITPDLNNSIDPSTSIIYCTQDLNLRTETFTVPGHALKFTAGPNSGETTDVPGKIQIPITELSLTFHQLPYMPVTAIRTLRGKVNSTTFLGATAGTVLFSAGSTTRDFNADGSVVQKVILHFTERSSLHKWNTLPSSKNLQWYDVQDNIGNKMYDIADLTPLVQF